MELLPQIVSTLATPPGLIVVVALVGFIVQMRWPWVGTLILGTAIVGCLALSLPMTAHRLMAGLQEYARPLELVPAKDSKPRHPVWVPKDRPDDPPHAIVVLGGGRRANAPEFDGDTVNALALERLRYGAVLQRKTGLPVLVTGGSVFGERTTEAELMKAALVEDFNVPVQWLETRSRNTLENARFSGRILADAKIKHIYLVTHAWHMRRAAWAFETSGIRVTPAPTGFHGLGKSDYTVLGYLPSMRGLSVTSLAMHEYLGYLWYTFQGAPPPVTSEPLPRAAPEPKAAR